ncbi:MAG: Nif3-like dinuclear metal center hexameric protein [Ruminococcus sp.]|nr:Nif3-like dinuclear metal center hexameric protein [Ruminococcus sp.]
MATVRDIYDEINKIAPFSIQESYDNSGLVVGNGDKTVGKILLALDITKSVAKEAAEKNCGLIISHHPVIFTGLKSLNPDNPAVILAKNDISAICMHTNFDIAKGGMNDILCEILGFVPEEPLAEENGVSIGYVCTCDDELMPKTLAKRVKQRLGNAVVRFVDTEKPVKKIAVCSGSGGSFLPFVKGKHIDAYITGDVKHDIFIDAYNNEICLVDAGHFYTENIFFDFIKNKLMEKYPTLDISVAQSNKDVTSYEI